jgi:excisionase family DNA binding protein
MTDELLTVHELAAYLKVAPATIQKRMRKRIFQKGVHYFRPRGQRPLFKKKAIDDWLEEKEPLQDSDKIPMARGYLQRKKLTG